MFSHFQPKLYELLPDSKPFKSPGCKNAQPNHDWVTLVRHCFEMKMALLPYSCFKSLDKYCCDINLVYIFLNKIVQPIEHLIFDGSLILMYIPEGHF